MPEILVIHGPNLNLLGQREPDVYGEKTLQDINQILIDSAKAKQIKCTCFQSNHEGAIIDRIQSAKNKFDFILINPAGYTHTSVAIRDAFLAISLPFIEIHLSNPYTRESFRHHSYLSDIAYGVVSGMGIKSYELAMCSAIDYCIQEY